MNHQSYYPLKFDTRHLRVYVWRIIESLHKLPRTGYKDRGVENPETVGEHSDEVVAIAEEYFAHIPGLGEMLRIHDWPKSKKEVGDRRTDSLCPPERRWSLTEKYEAELAAMEEIAQDMGPDGQRILQLWKEFDAGETERAKLANQIDKFQMIRKSIRYQKEGQPVIAQEFINSSGHFITDPILKQMMDKAIAEL